MSIEVKVPNLPESVSEATVADWHKQPGDRVSREENIVDLETDKVMLEVPSVADGVIKEILVEAGATVSAGDVLALIEEGSGGGSSDKGSGQDKSSQGASEDSASKQSADSDEAAGQSPAVRKMLAEHDLKAADIKGTGKGGRLTKSDVEAHLKSAPSKSGSDSSSSSKSSGSSVSSQPVANGGREEQRVPMTRIRQRIAERLVEAQTTAAMLTTFNEVNLGPLMESRARYKAAFEKAHGDRKSVV